MIGFKGFFNFNNIEFILRKSFIELILNTLEQVRIHLKLLNKKLIL
jgi:hypothetical protein